MNYHWVRFLAELLSRSMLCCVRINDVDIIYRGVFWDTLTMLLTKITSYTLLMLYPTCQSGTDFSSAFLLFLTFPFVCCMHC
jgi:hypothetical protein